MLAVEDCMYVEALLVSYWAWLSGFGLCGIDFGLLESMFGY